MNKEFVPFDLADKLKDLGFNELCISAYMKNWRGDEYILEPNPMKLDDRVHHEPLKSFYENIESLDKSDSIILYNFNEKFEDVDGEGNEYDEVCSAPLWQQVLRWLRETHQIFIEIKTDCTTEPKFVYEIQKFIGNPNDLSEREWDWYFHKQLNWCLYYTYDDALEKGIEEAIKEVVKIKN